MLEIEPRAVDRDEVVDLPLEGVREQVARAAQVSLAFLPDVADEIHGAERLHIRALEGADDGEHDGQSATVVPDAWTGERRPVAFDFDVRAFREHRVEVAFDEHRRTGAGSL